jgi:Protein of unknown function (DUF3592)
MSKAMTFMLIGAALTAGGAVGSWLVRRREQGHRPERHWVPTPAVIVESQQVGNEEPYQPRVRYRYHHGGADFECGKLAPLGWGHDDTTAEQVLARYPLGGTVTAYVNPEKPQQAVLVRDPTAREQDQNMVGSLALVAIGVLLFLYGLGS